MKPKKYAIARYKGPDFDTKTEEWVIREYRHKVEVMATVEEWSMVRRKGYRPVLLENRHLKPITQPDIAKL